MESKTTQRSSLAELSLANTPVTPVTPVTPEDPAPEPAAQAKASVEPSEAVATPAQTMVMDDADSSVTEKPDPDNSNIASALPVADIEGNPDSATASDSGGNNSPSETPAESVTKNKSNSYSNQGEQAEYRKALALVRDGQFEDAAESFNIFLETYPNSSYADNARYWIGETYYVTRDFEPALETFTVLVEDFPDSPKVPDTRLKIGYIHYEQHDWPAAREVLSSIVTAYPDTEVAQLASARLKRMEDEAH